MVPALVVLSDRLPAAWWGTGSPENSADTGRVFSSHSPGGHGVKSRFSDSIRNTSAGPGSSKRYLIWFCVVFYLIFMMIFKNDCNFAAF